MVGMIMKWFSKAQSWAKKSGKKVQKKNWNMFTAGPENFKKSRQKKLVKSNTSIIFREIAFLAVLNLFPSSKIDFWPFLKLQKMEFGQKISFS